MTDIRHGDRVELVYTSDPATRLQPGDRGTVRSVDGLGTLHVRWDNGSRLGPVPGEDIRLKNDDAKDDGG
jgi:hypothetical protein